MSYAGPLSLLQTYKLQKSESDYKLVQMQQELLVASSSSKEINNHFDACISKLEDARSRISEIRYFSTDIEEEKDGKIIYKDSFSNVIKDLQSFDFDMFSDLNPNDLSLRDQANYDNIAKTLDKNLSSKLNLMNAEYTMALAEVAAEEQDLQTNLQAEQTENSLLSSNIENMKSLVQQNVSKQHTYGYQ